MSWKSRAACKGVGLELFFNRRNTEDREKQKSLCFSCPVKKECLDYALNFEAGDPLRVGIWGGLLAKDRAKLKVKK
jgi:WhiB family redox-sensing transcriptional regulator